MKKLKFRINRGLDELMVNQFLNITGGGINFGADIIKLHPTLKTIVGEKDVKKRERFIKKYFEKYYKSHHVEIKEKTVLVKDKWRRIERKFFNITETYFNGYKFANGMYIAYASIINCNPRFLESKTFQFFYLKSVPDAVHTIAHELLHFIFFDFVNKKFQKEIKNLTEEQLWDLSEIFNVILLKSSQYNKIINKKLVIPYPDHKRYLYDFENKYKNSQSSEEFIRWGISVLNTKK